MQAGYEWDIGHFYGAERPDVDCFRSTSYGQSESEVLSNFEYYQHICSGMLGDERLRKRRLDTLIFF